MPSVRFRLNGVETAVDADPDRSLLDILRGPLRMTGPHFGCGANECGACNVIVGNRALASCDTPLWSVENKSVTTVEGLAKPDGSPSVLQDSFCETHALQCGYCTPGMLIAAQALLNAVPQPGEAEIREAIGGNLCRCTGYQQIVEAIQHAAARLASETT